MSFILHTTGFHTWFDMEMWKGSWTPVPGLCDQVRFKLAFSDTETSSIPENFNTVFVNYVIVTWYATMSESFQDYSWIQDVEADFP